MNRWRIEICCTFEIKNYRQSLYVLSTTKSPQCHHVDFPPKTRQTTRFAPCLRPNRQKCNNSVKRLRTPPPQRYYLPVPPDAPHALPPCPNSISVRLPKNRTNTLTIPLPRANRSLRMDWMDWRVMRRTREGMGRRLSWEGRIRALL